MLIAAVLAVLLGVASAARWRGAGLFRFILVAGGSMPAFLAAILGIVLFYNHLHWVPAPGRTSYLNAPTGPTGLLTVDGLLHGRPERDDRRDPAPHAPGASRSRSCRR